MRISVPVPDRDDAFLPHPAEIASSYVEVAQRASRLLAQYLKRRSREGFALPAEELRVAKAFMDLSARLLANPYRLAQTQMDMMRDHVHLWQQSLLKTMGMPFRAPAIADHDDRRFDDQAWKEDFLFDFLKQSYLITARHLHAALARDEGLDEAGQRRLKSITERYIAALSPTNFALTNPEVLRETLRSRGRNLIGGLRKLLRDLEDGDGPARVLRGNAAFRLGRDIAATAGKVIFQNELLQLIQYQPTTGAQYGTPLLIVPSWINRYYLFDLREGNSFVRWATDQGLTTFIISWVNPDQTLARKCFEDYLSDGTLAAIDAIERATSAPRVHLAGHCLGGTLVMATLASMAARRDERAASGTFLGSMFGGAEPGAGGETATPAGEDCLGAVDEKRRGDLASPFAADTVETTRANELVWSFVVGNYLLARDSVPADLLYWNADPTRVPAALHRFCLEQLFEAGREAGGLSLAGVRIDIAGVRVPCYFLATIEDRISPWRSSYIGARLPSGPTRFVLGAAGHVTGVINPPAAGRHGYWTHPAPPERADDFLSGASRHPGSWWSDWQRWLLTHMDGQVPARTPGEGALAVIEDAPGSYVGQR